MAELAAWIERQELTQTEAANVLMVSRPRGWREYPMDCTFGITRLCCISDLRGCRGTRC